MEATSPVFTDSNTLEKVFKAQDGSDVYNPLPMFRTEYALVSRWKLTDEERKHIAEGGDLFIAVLSSEDVILPIMPLACNELDAMATVLEAEKRAIT